MHYIRHDGAGGEGKERDKIEKSPRVRKHEHKQKPYPPQFNQPRTESTMYNTLVVL